MQGIACSLSLVRGLILIELKNHFLMGAWKYILKVPRSACFFPSHKGFSMNLKWFFLIHRSMFLELLKKLNENLIGNLTRKIWIWSFTMSISIQVLEIAQIKTSTNFLLARSSNLLSKSQQVWPDLIKAKKKSFEYLQVSMQEKPFGRERGPLRIYLKTWMIFLDLAHSCIH